MDKESNVESIADKGNSNSEPAQEKAEESLSDILKDVNSINVADFFIKESSEIKDEGSSG